MGKKSSQPTAPAPAPAITIPKENVFPAPTPAAPPPPVATPAPAAPAMVEPSGPNVFDQAQQYQTQAGGAYSGLASFEQTPMEAAQLGEAQTFQGVGAVQAAQAPQQMQVSQLATTDLGAYMSPYTQQVIEAGQADIERQRQLASENLAAQAQRANAFGGSRQAVQEGVLAGEALRQAGALSAQQRQQAFQTALQAGQFDIGQTQAARTLASQQQMQAGVLQQQAREAAAAREQAARAGNVAAANQFALQQAQFEQQANQATFGGQFQAAGVRQAGAGGLAGLGGQMFGQGMAVQQQIAAEAAAQRQLEQQLIDAQRQQVAQSTGSPLAGVGAATQVLGSVPYGQTTTTSQPFNPASLLMLA